MANEQANMQISIMPVAAEAMRAEIQALTATNVENNTRQSVGPKVGVPMMK